MVHRVTAVAAVADDAAVFALNQWQQNSTGDYSSLSRQRTENLCLSFDSILRLIEFALVAAVWASGLTAVDAVVVGVSEQVDLAYEENNFDSY
jgi:hypothetical protein